MQFRIHPLSINVISLPEGFDEAGGGTCRPHSMMHREHRAWQSVRPHWKPSSGSLDHALPSTKGHKWPAVADLYHYLCGLFNEVLSFSKVLWPGLASGRVSSNLIFAYSSCSKPPCLGFVYPVGVTDSVFTSSLASSFSCSLGTFPVGDFPEDTVALYSESQPRLSLSEPF